jgi:nitroimidazol reductase NimA-like FMN-containing flavoprotein (pyridoxamine 5'-phosphate oxidase superfamily)
MCGSRPMPNAITDQLTLMLLDIRRPGDRGYSCVVFLTGVIRRCTWPVLRQTGLVASFADVENLEPDLAERVRSILSSATNAVLGTLRRDGSPRLSGADPYFHDGQLRIWSMPQARKGEDLRRDPRVAVHSIPWDSRQPRDGAIDVGEADAKVNGTAVLTNDAGERSSFRAWLKAERGFEPPEDWDLFTIDIHELTVISVDAGQLMLDRWSTTNGRQTMRRS